MTKKRRLKISLLIFLVLMLVAPVVGLKTTFDRMIYYHDKRAEEGKEDSTHYLGDIQHINRPAIYGTGIGAISLVGTIVCGICLLRKKRHPTRVN